MGITNMIATIPGFLSPSVVGALTDDNVRDTFTIYLYATLDEIHLYIIDNIIEIYRMLFVSNLSCTFLIQFFKLHFYSFRPAEDRF